MALRYLPRLLIAAPHSGSGKTTVALGLMAALRRRGLAVRPFKVGPDYIDPGYHGLASGAPGQNLDSWLMDRSTMVRIFGRSAQGGFAVVEGVMGLYDGGRGGVSSTAEIAKILKIPVVLVIDGRSMGDSAAALALGFREYDREVNLAGVILNRLGSPSHYRTIKEALEGIAMPLFGALFRDEGLKISERHLGLTPAQENPDRGPLEAMAQAVEKGLDLEALISLAHGAPPLEIPDPLPTSQGPPVKIGVARDKAFSFYYPESLEELERRGAELVFFSPLEDRELPAVSGLIFGGGFPELFAQDLSVNGAMREAVFQAGQSGMPILAECGGLMYLCRELRNFQGHSFPMAGLVPARCSMKDRLQRVGYVEALALEDLSLAPKGALIRGHEFHFSTMEPDNDAFPWAFRFTKVRTGQSYDGGFRSSNVTASYLHLHFAGNPQLAQRFLDQCRHWERQRKS